MDVLWLFVIVAVPVIIWQLIVFVRGDIPEYRYCKQYNHAVRIRNQQRDEYRAQGGTGEPPNLYPIGPKPPPQSPLTIGLLLIGCVVAAYIVFVAIPAWIAADQAGMGAR